MENKNTQIIRVDAYDGDCFGIGLSSGHSILLELGSRVCEPDFVKLIESGMFDKPQTDGVRLFWANGPAFTLEEILAMVAQSGDKTRADGGKIKEAIGTVEKKKWRVLAICGAVITGLSGLFIAYGIIDAIKRSEYQDVGTNTPVVILAALILIAGVTMLGLGLKKRG